MEENKKPGRTLQDYAHLFLSRRIDKEKSNTATPSREKSTEAEKNQPPISVNETPSPEQPGSAAEATLIPDTAAAGAPLKTDRENQHSKPFAVAVSGPRTSLANTMFAFNLSVDFLNRGRQVMVLNADLSFASMNYLAALQLSAIKAARQHPELPTEKPAPEFQLITVDTDITLLSCPWPDEHNPIIDEITSASRKADVIIINISTGFSSNAKALFKAADEIILISGVEPAQLIDTYSIIKTIHQFSPLAHIGIIILGDQEAAQKGFKKLQEVAAEFLNIDLFWYGCIPWDETLTCSISSKAALPPDAAGARAVHAVGDLLLNLMAQRRLTETAQEPGFLEKLFLASAQPTTWTKRFQSLTPQHMP
jgi:MinD-like ATPase involved in chromosome partitioning or flagellar assembly